MSSRDRINEIESKRERSTYKQRYPTYDLIRIRTQWNENPRVVDGFSDFILVKLVSMIEIGTRAWIIELIESGEPYSQRAGDMFAHAGIKIDFNLLHALQGKRITLGELIGHTLPLGTFPAFVTALNKLVGEDFISTFDGVIDRFATEVMGQAAEPIISDTNNLRRHLARLFEARNIVVHEMPIISPYKSTEVDGFFLNASSFMLAANEVLVKMLYGDVPLTQTDMTISEGENYRKSDAELSSLLNELDPEKKSVRLWAAQEAWNAYRDAEAELNGPPD